VPPVPPVAPAPAGPPPGLSAYRRLTGLARSALDREEIRYLVVGGATALGYLVLLAALLATGTPYMIAILIDQAITFSVAFPVYRKVIFRSTGRWQSDLARFAGVWSGGFIAGIVATPALVELAGLPPLLAQIIAVAVVAVLTFLGHKFVSFRR
jgi:putative flippase GtrA